MKTHELTGMLGEHTKMCANSVMVQATAPYHTVVSAQ